MLELATRGVEEITKVKRRVTRLYGMGRISLETFNTIHAKVVELENLLKEAQEIDADDNDGSNN